MSAGLTLKPSYYEALKRLTLELAGIRLGQEYTFLIETRLASLARKEGYDSLVDMVEELFSRGQSRLAIQIVSALLERDTHFYDDKDDYRSLLENIVPTLHEACQGGTLRILSLGCSSGQEPYSLAMWLDKMRDRFPNMAVHITGVDYPSDALDRAKAGIYTHFEVQRGLPARDLITYFERKGEDWVVKAPLRSCVVFKEFHLMSNLDALGQFHLAFFRNSLPHYASPAQIRLLQGLSRVVVPSGYLMLGSKETLGKASFGFDSVGDMPGLFRRREQANETDPAPVVQPHPYQGSHIAPASPPSIPVRGKTGHV